MRKVGRELFSSARINVEIDNRSRRVHYEIEHLDGDQVLATSVEDWCDFFEDKFRFDVPVLREESISVDQTEEEINLSRQPGMDAREGPVLVQGTRTTFAVPFDGDSDLFRFRPNTFNLSPPQGYVAGQELQISYLLRGHDAAAVRAAFDRDLSNVRDWLGWLGESVAPFNDRLRISVREDLERRQEKLLRDREMLEALGFPLRKRGDRRSYIVDGPRKKIRPQRPTATETPFRPEPELHVDQYQEILDTVEHMVAAMERSPSAFKTMGEEDLRQQLLVGLNASFEGQATGETFNFEGKTDILIRHQGKNLFIGECKIWRGAKKLTETIDQILAYASWRDTKTAILVFNRNKDFSAVLRKIPSTVEDHPNFKRWLSYQHESSFRCNLHHRDDVNRELTLTVMAFEVPKPD